MALRAGIACLPVPSGKTRILDMNRLVLRRGLVVTGRLLFWAVLLSLGTRSVLVQADPSVSERTVDFQRIAAQLDPGGELFLVVHSGRWLDRLFLSLAGGEGGLPASEPEEREFRDLFEQWRRFVNRQGLSAFRGFGISTLQRQDGQHELKLFVRRDSADSNLPFWRGLSGWQPRRLASLDFVPSDFSMVAAASSDPAALWQVWQSALHDVRASGAEDRFEAVNSFVTFWTGMDPAVFLGSLRDEWLLAGRFEEKSFMNVPSADGELSIPRPSFLFIAGTGEDLFRGAVESRLARHGITLAEIEVTGIRVRHASEPLPVMQGIQPAFASPPGFFLIGSSPGVVEEALLAYRHRNGFVTRPVFRDAFKDIPMVNNGILYIERDSARILGHWKDSVFPREGFDSAKGAVSARLENALRFSGGEFFSGALALFNRRDGVLLMGNSCIGGESLIRQIGAVVLSLLDRLTGSAAGFQEDGK